MQAKCLKCDSCGETFTSEEEDWRAFINEAKAEGWLMVKDGDFWYHYCSLDCKQLSEE